MATKPKTEAIEHLRTTLTDGDIVHIFVTNVSSSGMSRTIKVYKLKVRDGQVIPLCLSRLASTALGWRYDDKHEGVRVSGTGMDMGFHLVYELGGTIGRSLKHEWL